MPFLESIEEEGVVGINIIIKFKTKINKSDKEIHQIEEVEEGIPFSLEEEEERNIK